MRFADASDQAWEGTETQAPKVDLTRGIPIEVMSHDPLGLLTGSF